MALPALPFELVEHIVSVSKSASLLVNLSLLNRALSSFALSVLYSHVSLSTETQLERFSKTLRSSTFLCSRIRTLTVRHWPDDTSDSSIDALRIVLCSLAPHQRLTSLTLDRHLIYGRAADATLRSALSLLPALDTLVLPSPGLSLTTFHPSTLATLTRLAIFGPTFPLPVELPSLAHLVCAPTGGPFPENRDALHAFAQFLRHASRTSALRRVTLVCDVTSVNWLWQRNDVQALGAALKAALAEDEEGDGDGWSGPSVVAKLVELEWGQEGMRDWTVKGGEEGWIWDGEGGGESKGGASENEIVLL